jgi:hypothetical protein
MCSFSSFEFGYGFGVEPPQTYAERMLEREDRLWKEQHRPRRRSKVRSYHGQRDLRAAEMDLRETDEDEEEEEEEEDEEPEEDDRELMARSRSRIRRSLKAAKPAPTAVQALQALPPQPPRSKTVVSVRAGFHCTPVLQVLSHQCGFVCRFRLRQSTSSRPLQRSRRPERHSQQQQPLRLQLLRAR